jgi:hypothetical protein
MALYNSVTAELEAIKRELGLHIHAEPQKESNRAKRPNNYDSGRKSACESFDFKHQVSECTAILKDRSIFHA